MARKSTGKRQRFEVFKRDHFTCQYCGAQPPDVVLVLDHITPVSQGGTNSEDNIITSCEPCNQGKADKSLAERSIRPDADLLYLETQQDIAEIKRYHQSLAEREAQVLEVVKELQEVWIRCSGLDWHPADHVVRQLVEMYSPELAERALVDVAPKVAGGYISGYGDKWIRYLHAVARNMSADETQEHQS